MGIELRVKQLYIDDIDGIFFRIFLPHPLVRISPIAINHLFKHISIFNNKQDSIKSYARAHTRVLSSILSSFALSLPSSNDQSVIPG